jgi:hypothetical protein
VWVGLECGWHVKNYSGKLFAVNKLKPEVKSIHLVAGGPEMRHDGFLGSGL